MNPDFSTSVHMHLRAGSNALRLEQLTAALAASLPRTNTLNDVLIQRLSNKLLELADTDGNGEIDVHELDALLSRFPNLCKVLGESSSVGLPTPARGPAPLLATAIEGSSEDDADDCAPSGAHIGSMSSSHSVASVVSPSSWSSVRSDAGESRLSIARRCHCPRRKTALWLTALLVVCGAVVAAAVVRYIDAGASVGGVVAHSGGALLYVCMFIICASMLRRSFAAVSMVPSVAALFPQFSLPSLHIAAVGAAAVILPIHIGGHIADWTARSLPIAFVFSLSNPEGLPLVYAAAGTGVALLFVFAAMAAGYLARKVDFRVFYYSHAVGVPAVVVLIILHAPHAWWALLPPLAIFALELLARGLQARAPPLRIVSFALLPGSAIELRIARPEGFSFVAGQYVWLCFPAMGSRDYHPFCISSPPEASEVLTFHIRVTSPGGWTGRLRAYLEVQQEKVCSSSGSGRKMGGVSSRRMLIANPLAAVPTYHVPISTGGGDSVITNATAAAAAARFSLPFTGSAARSPFSNVPPASTPSTTRSLSRAAAPPTATTINAAATAAAVRGVRVSDPLAQMVVHIDGPYPSPAQGCLRCAHSILVCAGMGITPAASILASILARARAGAAAAELVGGTTEHDRPHATTTRPT